MAGRDTIRAHHRMLLATGEERGCLEESEIDRLAETLELGDADLEDLRDQVAQRGIAVHDDCGRVGVPPTSYADDDLVQHTIDSMGQFLSEAGRLRLLTAAEELELAKRIERGDLAAKERLINSQPAPRRLDRASATRASAS